jgi:hypothetical protein
MAATLFVSVPTDLDPTLVAMLVLRALIVLVVVGVVVRGYLRRRRTRGEILRESRQWPEDDDE